MSSTKSSRAQSDYKKLYKSISKKSPSSSNKSSKSPTKKIHIQQEQKTPSAYKSKKNNSNQTEYKEFDLNTTEKSGKNNTGNCDGCGMENSPLRAVTKEFLCPSCRDNIHFKLITKTTVLNKYPNLDFVDLIEGFQNKTIQCFFMRNWHNYNAKPIKLYYEREMQELSQRKGYVRPQDRILPFSAHQSLIVEKE